MKASSLIWYFDKDLRNVDDKKFKDMRVPEKVGIINRGIDIFFEKIFTNRGKDPKFERWLKPLYKDNVPLVKKKDFEHHVLYENPDKMESITSVYVNVKKGDCKSSFEANPIMNQSVKNALNNEMWMPSFEFEQTFRTNDEGGISIYHKKAFVIEEAIINYVKRPNHIHAAGLVKNNEGQYVYHDGTIIDKDVDLDFGEGAYIPIVNISVMLAVDNPSDMNLEANKILSINNI